MRKAALLVLAVFLCSCASQQSKSCPKVSVSQAARELAKEGISPCRVLPCSFAGKTEVEVIDVPAQDKGDFIIYPRKEAVIVKPIDLLPPEKETR